MKKLWLAVVILLLALPPMGAAIAGGGKTVSVYFLREAGSGLPESVAVQRTIPATTSVLTNALKALFRGPTDEERRRGLFAGFAPETVADYNTECQAKRDRKTLKPLGAYFIGASILRDGTAVVDFRSDAMCYLENTPGNAYRVMEPIERTARQFPAVKQVEYSINGKRITGWDA